VKLFVRQVNEEHLKPRPTPNIAVGGTLRSVPQAGCVCVLRLKYSSHIVDYRFVDGRPTCSTEMVGINLPLKKTDQPLRRVDCHCGNAGSLNFKTRLTNNESQAVVACRRLDAK